MCQDASKRFLHRVLIVHIYTGLHILYTHMLAYTPEAVDPSVEVRFSRLRIAWKIIRNRGNSMFNFNVLYSEK